VEVTTINGERILLDSDKPVCEAMVMHEYSGVLEEGELTIKQGMHVMVLENSDSDGWWLARLDDGSVGTVPSNFLTVMTT